MWYNTCLYVLSLSLSVFPLSSAQTHFTSIANTPCSRSHSHSLNCHPGCCCRDQLNDCYRCFDFWLSLIGFHKCNHRLHHGSSLLLLFTHIHMYILLILVTYSLPVYRYSLHVTPYRYSLLVSLAVTPTTAAQRVLSLAH